MIQSDQVSPEILAEYLKRVRPYLVKKAHREQTTPEEDKQHALNIRWMLDKLPSTMSIAEKFDWGNKITVEILREEGILPPKQVH